MDQHSQPQSQAPQHPASDTHHAREAPSFSASARRCPLRAHILGLAAEAAVKAIAGDVYPREGKAAAAARRLTATTQSLVFMHPSLQESVCGGAAAAINIVVTFPPNKVMFRQQVRLAYCCRYYCYCSDRGFQRA